MCLGRCECKDTQTCRAALWKSE